MPARIMLKTAEGNEVLPTANGVFYTPDMSTLTSKRTQVYVEFFSDAAGTLPVTPTAGTVTVDGSPMGDVFLPPADGGVIDATKVSVPIATYDVPFFEGRMVLGRAAFAGITGAPFARVMFWRYD